MVREIIWTKRANRKFNQIIEFLEKEWGEKVTQSFIIRTHTIIQLIAEKSEIGTIENSLKNIRGFVLTNIIHYSTDLPTKN